MRSDSDRDPGDETLEIGSGVEARSCADQVRALKPAWLIMSRNGELQSLNGAARALLGNGARRLSDNVRGALEELLGQDLLSPGKWSESRCRACVRARNGRRYSCGLEPLSKRDDVLVILVDVTDLIETTDRLQQLAAVTESAADALLTMRPDGTITSWNRPAEHLFGFPAKEVLGKLVQDVIKPREGSLGFSSLLSQLEDKERIVNAHCVDLRSDGREVTTSVTLSPIFNTDGELVGSSAFFRDVTAEVEEAEAVQRSRQLLRLIADSVPALIAYVDEDERYQFTNSIYGRFFGKTPQQLKGASVRNVVGERIWSAIETDVRRALEGEQVTFERQLELPNSTQPWVAGAYVPDWRDDGSVRGFAALVYDVTTRKQLEQSLAEADTRKDEFLAMLSHELRNALAPLRTAVETCLEQPDQDEAKGQMLSLINRQTTHLHRLVNDLLDAARVRRGLISLHVSEVDLNELAVQVIDSMRAQAKRAGVELTLQVGELPLSLGCDRDRIRQVMTNLVGNAIKYSPGGKVVLRIFDQANDARVEVIDNGQGISEELMPRIFEPYVRGEPRGESDSGSLGIGLSTTKALVELHGGSISTHSEGSGRGARFVVNLPKKARTKRATRDGEYVEKAESEKRRVLVVEDNEDAAETMRLVLETWGHEVHVSLEGDKAVDMAREVIPDLILLDIGLPGTDGYEVVRQMRAVPELDQTSIVALTGYGGDEERDASRRAGFDYHLVKPAGPDDLRFVLAKLPRERA